MRDALVGKGNTKVQLVEYTHDGRGNKLASFIWEYPRIIHAEVLRHRALNHSVSSSRAIPVPRMLEMVSDNPAMPFHWGANQAGMSANGYIKDTASAEKQWKKSAIDASDNAHNMHSLGLHKQVVNRVLEPYQWIREVVTGTDFENFFKLRIHEAAQPEIHELALLTYQALEHAIPRLLSPGEYHLPFITSAPNGNDGSTNYIPSDIESPTSTDVLNLEDAIKVSMSCCAQSSFRRNDSSKEKAETLTDLLLFSDPVHASPAEHIGTPFSEFEYNVREDCKSRLVGMFIDLGSTKQQAESKSDHVMYSGNLRGFEQHRKTISNETFTGKFNCDVELETGRFENN